MSKVYLFEMYPEDIVARLKKGEKVFKDNSTEWYEMVDGVICFGHNGKIKALNTIINKEMESLYFENLDGSFEISCDGLYKTRKGEIAFISGCNVEDFAENRFFGIIEGKSHLSFWTVNGNNFSDKNDDLVEFIGDAHEL